MRKTTLLLICAVFLGSIVVAQIYAPTQSSLEPDQKSLLINDFDLSEYALGSESTIPNRSINLNEDFEGTMFPPIGWQTDDWIRTTSANLVITGSASAAVQSSLGWPARTLDTPWLDVDGSWTTITYQRRGLNNGLGAGNSFLQIQYQEYGETTWTNLGAAIEITVNTITSSSIDVSGLANGIYRFRFSVTSTFNVSGFFSWVSIDDVVGGPLFILPTNLLVTGLNKDYSRIPQAQLPSSLTLSANVINTGEELTEPTNVLFSIVGGSYSETAAIPVPLEYAASVDVTSPNAWITTNLTPGDYTITYEADHEPSDPDDRTDEFILNVNEYIYARDNNTPLAGVGSTGGALTLGNIFEINAAATLNFAQVRWPALPAGDLIFIIGVYALDNAVDRNVIAIVYTSGEFTRQQSMQGTTVDFPLGGIDLIPGTYMLAVRQLTNISIRMGCDLTPWGAFYIADNPVIPTNFANTAVGFGNITLRMNFSDCPAATGLAVSNITSTAADLSWASSGGQALWNVEVGLPGFTPGEGEESTSIYGLGSTTWQPKSLTPGTTYQFYVQADCGDETVSDWAGPGSFTTYCAFECPPGSIAENEPCGDNVNGGCNMGTPTFIQVNPGDIICSTTWANNGNRDTDWFELILTEPSQVILRAYAETGLVFGLVAGIDPSDPDCANVTGISPFNLTELCSPTTLDLGVLVAGTHWFIATMPVFNGFPCNVNYWIKFEVNEVECAPPTNLTVSNINTTSADLLWTPGGTEDTWNIEWGIAGFSQGTGTLITGTNDNPYELTGLDPNTGYDFYVQADCGEEDRLLSNWAGPLSFTTDCLPFELPLVENFDTTPLLELPECWKRETNTVGWRVTNGITPFSGPKTIATFYDETQPKDDWFFSAALELTGGESYYFNFLLKAPGYNNIGEKLAVKLGDAPMAFAMTAGTIYENTDIQYADWTLITGLFSPATTGVYYIGWHAFSDADLDYIAVDDILVDILRYPVTFNVDITTIDGFNHDTEVIYLAGGFPGAFWNEPGTNPDLLMERVGETDVYTITLELPAGYYEYKYFKNAGWGGGEWQGGDNRSIVIDSETSTCDVFGGVIVWANLQWPPDGSIIEGNPFSVYGQVYIPLVTGDNDPGYNYNLEAWIGVSDTESDPSGWETWIPASYNGPSGDNDEYTANIATGLEPGTYYYATRYRYGQICGSFIYGGNNGGFWDGTTNVSGVLTVTAAGPPANRLIDFAANGCFDATNEVEINGATVENVAIADIRSGGTITATNFGVESGGTAYLTAEESISLGDNVLLAPGATGLVWLKIDTFEPCVLAPPLVASEEIIVPEELPVIANQESFFKVFPNPTTSTFKLELLNADETRINVEIFGMMGERVFQDVLFGSMIYEFDLSNMPRGIYFIRVLKGDEMGIDKVIKQ